MLNTFVSGGESLIQELLAKKLNECPGSTQALGPCGRNGAGGGQERVKRGVPHHTSALQQISFYQIHGGLGPCIFEFKTHFPRVQKASEVCVLSNLSMLQCLVMLLTFKASDRQVA